MATDPGFLVFAFSTGMATFFSPCSVALIPAYVGYFVGLDDREGQAGSAWRSALAGARFGGAAASGVLALFAVAAGLVWLARTRFDLSSRALAGAVDWLGIAMGGVVIALGVLMLAGRGPVVAVPLRAPLERSVLGMAGFGAVYAIVSMGCTLPIVLALIVQATFQGVVGGTLGLLAYGAGLALLVFAASIALAVGRDAVTARLRTATGVMRVASGAVLVAAGVYVIWYYAVLVGP